MHIQRLKIELIMGSGLFINGLGPILALNELVEPGFWAGHSNMIVGCSFINVFICYVKSCYD